jgi:hypothetical protein
MSVVISTTCGVVPRHRQPRRVPAQLAVAASPGQLEARRLAGRQRAGDRIGQEPTILGRDPLLRPRAEHLLARVWRIEAIDVGDPPFVVDLRDDIGQMFENPHQPLQRHRPPLLGRGFAGPRLGWRWERGGLAGR